MGTFSRRAHAGQLSDRGWAQAPVNSEGHRHREGKSDGLSVERGECALTEFFVAAGDPSDASQASAMNPKPHVVGAGSLPPTGDRNKQEDSHQDGQ